MLSECSEFGAEACGVPVNMGMWGGFREEVYLSWTSHMGGFMEMAAGMVDGGIWAVGAMGIQDQTQSVVNGQGEA